MNKTVYKFNSKEIDLSDFDYAYSPHAIGRNRFMMYNDCVANFEPEKVEDFSYVSIITKKKYGIGVKATAKCAFEKIGAPLIVFTDDMTDEDGGTKLYGLHFEVVAYEGGCNVWHVVPNPENTARPIKSTKIGFAEFEIQPDELITISVEFMKGKIAVDINGNSFEVENSDIPESFNVGVTACEGPNKFYEFTIEE